MKLKLFTFIALALFILTGCTQQEAKTAKQHGSGISVKMGEDLNIKQLQLKIYEGGLKEVYTENVVHADSSTFSKGDVIWFDVPSSFTNTDSSLTVALSFSENIDGTSAQTTEKMDISEVDRWANLELNWNYELKLIELD